MQLAESRKHRKQRVDRTLVHSERKSAAAKTAKVFHAAARILTQIQHPLRIIEEQFAGSSQPSGTRTAHKKRLARPVFQLSYGHADRRLRAKELLRGPRKTLLLRDGEKHLQFIEIHG